MALEGALDALRGGEVDVAFAGGSDGLCELTYAGFNSLRAVAEGPTRPYRAEREGLSIGEGAGIVVLETEEHARARGATVLAELAGAASSCDAHHMTAPHPEGLGALNAMRDALRFFAPDLPVFDFPTHARADREERAEPKPIILVDGILVLADPTLADRFDQKIYVHTPDDIRLIRRIRRDIVSRGRTAMQVLAQYERTVRPMHKQYVEPSRDVADLVLDGTGDIDENIARIRSLLPL